MALPKTPAVVTAAMEGLNRLATLERTLAVVLTTVPFLLMGLDGRPARDSISAYYDMATLEAYFFPLTVAAMLFIVNGVVKNQTWYNWVLGAALSFVILLNHDDFPLAHAIAALVFFLGNVAVMFRFNNRVNRQVKRVLGIGVVAALAATYFGRLSLFQAESLSLFFIAAHYILDSLSHSNEVAAS